MWTLAGGLHGAAEATDHAFVAVIALVGGVALLWGLAVRSMGGRRRRRTGSDYS